MTVSIPITPIGAMLIEDRPDRHDVECLEAKLDEHNIATTGIRDATLLTIVLRDIDDTIIAGVHGWTWGGSCEIQTLWVDEQLRGQRVGTRLMDAAEGEARARGARQIVLSTHSFQALPFYERRGFEIVGRVDDHPVGFSNFYLRKRL